MEGGLNLSMASLVEGFKQPEVITTPEPIEQKQPETPTEEDKQPEVVTPPVEETEDTNDKPFTSLLRQEYLPDDNTEYEASFEGVSNLVKSVAEVREKAGYEAAYDELYSHLPEVKDYIQYRINGGKPEEYFKTLSETSAPTFDLENEDDQRAIIKSFLSATLDEEDIENHLVTLEETSKLASTAKKYFDKLEATKSTKLAELTAQQEQAAKEQQEATTNYWNSIKTVVDSGKLGNNTTVPVNDRKAFFEWLAVPTKEGIAQQQLDWQQMSAEDKLAFQYFIFKKGDVSKLATRQTTTTKVDEQLKNLRPGSRMENKESAKSAPINIPTIKGTTFTT